jgi:dTDP-4-amino-4,6-dideoxygalactose transaminase
MQLNPFQRQLPSLSPVSLEALLAGLGAQLGVGSPLEEVAALLREEFGATDVVLTDSGTSALNLAIRLAVESTGRMIVALPAFSCYDLATAAVGSDSAVVFYDLDPSTLAPDPHSLARALESCPGAVVGAHLFGVPFDIDGLRTAARNAGSWFIEDAAQGSGGEWKGQTLGSFGDLSVLSFGRGKGRTGGAGGALLIRDRRGHPSSLPDTYLLGRAGGGTGVLLKLLGQWVLGRPSLYGLPASIPALKLGETTYHEPRQPRSMEAGASAALLVNWNPSAREAGLRRSAGERLRCIVEGRNEVSAVTPPAGAAAGWLRFPVVLAKSPAATAAKAASRSGAARGYPLPLHALPAMKGRIVSPVSAPGAWALAERLWTLPTHSRASTAQALRALADLCRE